MSALYPQKRTSFSTLGRNSIECRRSAVRPSHSRNSDSPSATQTNSSARSGSQIDIPTPNPGATIVDADCDTSTVTDPNARAKWQSAMSRRHRGTIYPLPIGCATSAITIASAVDACHLCMCNVHKAEQHQHDTNGSALQINGNLHTSSPLRPHPHHFDQQKSVAEIQRGASTPGERPFASRCGIHRSVNAPHY